MSALYLRCALEASLVAQRLKCLPETRETQVRSLGREDPLQKEMVTHSSILAWRISWREEPGRLQSMGLQRVGHNWATSLPLSFLSFHLGGSLQSMSQWEEWLKLMNQLYYFVLPLVDSFYIFPETVLPLEWKLKQSLDFSGHSWWPDIKHNTQISKYNNNQIIIKTPNLILSWGDSSFSNLGLCKLQVESLWLRNGRVFSYFSKHLYSSCSIFLWRLGHAGGEKEEGAQCALCVGCPSAISLAGVHSGLWFLWIPEGSSDPPPPATDYLLPVALGEGQCNPSQAGL